MINEKLYNLLKSILGRSSKIGRIDRDGITYIVELEKHVFNQKLKTNRFLCVHTTHGVFCSKPIIDPRDDKEFTQVMNGLVSDRWSVYNENCYKILDKSELFNYFILEKIDNVTILKENIQYFETKKMEYVVI